jgi:hypothetical protein
VTTPRSKAVRVARTAALQLFILPATRTASILPVILSVSGNPGIIARSLSFPDYITVVSLMNEEDLRPANAAFHVNVKLKR